MTDEDAGPGRGSALPRAVLVLALLAIASVGLGAAQLARKDMAGPLRYDTAALHRFAIGYLICLVLAPVLVTALVRARVGTAPRSGRSGVLVLLLILVTLAALAALTLVLGTHTAQPLRIPEYGPLPLRGHGPRTTTVHVPLFVPLVVVAVAVLCILVVAWTRRSSRRAPTPVTGVEPPLDPAATLRSATDAGTSALHGTDDAREAVLACYQAMEEALRAGTARPTYSDTPTEVLDRAVRAGVLHGPGGSILVRLFAEARYSRHPFGDQHRRAAERALAEIRNDLEARR